MPRLVRRSPVRPAASTGRRSRPGSLAPRPRTAVSGLVGLVAVAVVAATDTAAAAAAATAAAGTGASSSPAVPPRAMPAPPATALRSTSAPAAAALRSAAAIVPPAPPSPAARAAPERPHAAAFPRGAVAADHPLASEAGASMLRIGGNAVDAAVATSFALSVVRPDSCGIGGGGFMLVHLPAADGAPARTVALDYRETAPAAVGPDHFVRLRDAGLPDDASRTGVHAVGVPGTVAGLLTAHARFGRLSRATVMGPAIALARDGWTADAHHVAAARRLEARVASAPHALPRAAWIRERLGRSGRIAVGDRLENPEQARALELIAADGLEAFYRGPIAEAIVRVMEDAGGPMTREDLAAYAPRPLEPVAGTYRGRTVLSMPPPSSGGVAIVQTLGILERLRARGIAGEGPSDPARMHALAEALKHAFADRAEFLADPDFAAVPVAELLAPERLDRLAGEVDPRRTRPPEAYGAAGAPPEDGGTSHVSVVDADGMAVACTETINLAFGSMVPVPGFGFVLNDEMDDFTTLPGEANAFGLVQSARNAPEPGKRPLSSMSPTIVLDADGAVEIVAGASGGPRIITGTLQVILHVIDFGMDAAGAVEHPRLHHQWRPDVLQLEPAWRASAPGDGGAAGERAAATGAGAGADADARAGAAAPVPALEARGHVVGERDEVGAVQAIIVIDGARHAVSDPRKGGRPAGH